MDKIEIEDILISMKTSDNEEIINKLLGKIKVIDEVSLQNAIMQAGGTKETIIKFFESKISERQDNTAQKHTLINKFFSYGISANCVHLHLPTDLHSMIAERGISGTIDTVNMYLLDAIDKIKELKDNGHDEFQGKDSIYMISPILLGRELRFLEELDFKTRTYKKQELNSQDFLSDNSEAKLATQIFGKDKNVGTAQINFDMISTNEWQTKKEEKLKEFASKGITFMPQKQELSKKVSVEEIEKLEKIGEGECANIYRNGSIVYKILKEKFTRFLAQSKHIRKLSFINKFIDRQIKMLPTDVQEVVNQSRVDTIQEQTQKINDTDEKRKFIQRLRNWTPFTTQGLQNKRADRMVENLKENNNYDDLEL